MSVGTFAWCPGCGEDWFAFWSDDDADLRFECANLCEYDDEVATVYA